MARVLLSAAHTLENPGEIFQDLREADLTRKILKMVIPHLEKTGVEFQAVPLDLPLFQRIEWINKSGYSYETGDIFIEIHVNDGNKRGIEGWFRDEKSDTNTSQRLSEKIMEGVCKKTGYENRGAKSEFDHELGSLIILNQTNTISTAIEFLYIDNEEDIKILKDDVKLDAMAKALADSIGEYIKDEENKKFNETNKNKRNEVKKKSPFGNFGGLGGFGDNDDDLDDFGLGGTAGAGSDPFAGFGAPKNPFPTPPATSNFGIDSTPATTPSTKPVLMDRDERKKMIEETYEKVLGKKPAQSDLNFHLNTGTNKNDLIVKLVEGKDHEQMAKDAAELKEIKTKLEQFESENAQLKSASKDFASVQESLNRLLEHKNMLISRFHNELVAQGIMKPGEHIDSLDNRRKKDEHESSPSRPVKRKKGVADSLMRILKI